MTTIQPKAGFDWSLVYWSARVRGTCSYCRKALGPDEVPLRLFRKNGSAASFCKDCQRCWWGIESYWEYEE